MTTTVEPNISSDSAETIADLLHRLGDIPAERVRLHPAPGTATEAVHCPQLRALKLLVIVPADATWGAINCGTTARTPPRTPTTSVDAKTVLMIRVMPRGLRELLIALGPPRAGLASQAVRCGALRAGRVGVAAPDGDRRPPTAPRRSASKPAPHVRPSPGGHPVRRAEQPGERLGLNRLLGYGGARSGEPHGHFQPDCNQIAPLKAPPQVPVRHNRH